MERDFHRCTEADAEIAPTGFVVDLNAISWDRRHAERSVSADDAFLRPPRWTSIDDSHSDR